MARSKQCQHYFKVLKEWDDEKRALEAKVEKLEQVVANLVHAQRNNSASSSSAAASATATILLQVQRQVMSTTLVHSRLIEKSKPLDVPKSTYYTKNIARK